MFVNFLVSVFFNNCPYFTFVVVHFYFKKIIILIFLFVKSFILYVLSFVFAFYFLVVFFFVLFCNGKSFKIGG